MNRYWFRRKEFGFGATPATWEGWLVMLVYVGLLIGLARYLTGRESPAHIPVFLFVAIVLTAVVVWISWIKTEGGWRWKWGERDKRG
jgi:MFS superfamily sulfate permease-like transporter